MSTGETTPIGSIHISPKAIATIAWQAALQSYGIVGLAPRNLADDIAGRIVKDPLQGVEVSYDGNQITIDLYVIVEYGTRIKSVAHSVANTVRYQVEKAIGLPVQAINVHVQGLRVSEED